MPRGRHLQHVDRRLLEPGEDQRHRLQRRQRLHPDRHLPGGHLHRRQPGDLHGPGPVPYRGDLQPSTGVCTNPTLANGTACNDGNACTQIDTCQAGTCTGSSPVTCTALDQCHVAGTCSPSTGACSNPNAANGTTCNDGNACTTTDTCQAGTCTGTAVTCAALDQCHVAGTCNPSNGTCSNPTSQRHDLQRRQRLHAG